MAGCSSRNVLSSSLHYHEPWAHSCTAAWLIPTRSFAVADMHLPAVPTGWHAQFLRWQNIPSPSCCSSWHGFLCCQVGTRTSMERRIQWGAEQPGRQWDQWASTPPPLCAKQNCLKAQLCKTQGVKLATLTPPMGFLLSGSLWPFYKLFSRLQLTAIEENKIAEKAWGGGGVFIVLRKSDQLMGGSDKQWPGKNSSGQERTAPLWARKKGQISSRAQTHTHTPTHPLFPALLPECHGSCLGNHTPYTRNIASTLESSFLHRSRGPHNLTESWEESAQERRDPQSDGGWIPSSADCWSLLWSLTKQWRHKERHLKSSWASSWILHKLYRAWCHYLRALLVTSYWNSQPPLAVKDFQMNVTSKVQAWKQTT